MGETPRRFTEKQAAEILKRAAAAPESGPQPEGISEDELLTVGRELGLSDQQIRSAMFAFDEKEETHSQERWLGAPPSYEMERIVPGQLTDDAWNTIVAELNTAFAQALPGETQGNIRSWQYKHGLGYVNLLASPAGKDTRLRLVAYIDEGLSVWLMISIFLSLVTASSLGAAVKPLLLGILVAAAAVVLIFTMLRTFVGSWYREDKKKIRKLMDRLAEIPSATHGQEVLEATVAEAAGEMTQRLYPSP